MKKKHYSDVSVELELTGPDLPASLTAINEAEIPLLHIKRVDEVTCVIEIQKKYLKDIQAMCIKKGDSLCVRNTAPVYRLLSAMKAHAILALFLIFLVLITLYVPTHILFIRVVGNVQIPANAIIASAERCGLTLGIHRRDIRSEKIKNQLLEDIPRLQWVGVNSAGCVAEIHVLERVDRGEETGATPISNIIASSDGYILGGTATKGTALFSEGQSVKKGQILISAYTDCGRYVQAVGAEGEIYAQTSHKITAVTPVLYGHRMEDAQQSKKYSLLLGKKRINLWKDSGISDGTCGRIYKEYNISFPGGFVLPVALCVEIYFCGSIEEESLEEQDVISKLEQCARECLSSQMIAGQIICDEYNIQMCDGVYMFCGNYVCHEMIGREQKIEFGDSNGKVS